MSSSAIDDGRVLILAPIGRDGKLTSELLQRAGIPCHVCADFADAAALVRGGAGAVVLTEEALNAPGLGVLTDAIDEQPAWSDIPVLLFAGSTRERASLRTLNQLEVLRNVTLLDRPVRIAAVVSTVRAALRSRRRQYELRDVLLALGAAREEAERANRLKDEFLATLSHELRTPLNAILGWASMLSRGQLSPDVAARANAIIERNARAQRALVDDLLDVSRIVSGKLLLTKTPSAVLPLLTNAVDAVAHAAAAKRLTVTTVVDAPAAVVYGDGPRLQQVFWNLLANAVKFTPEEGRVEARLRTDGATVVIEVIDSGVGIDAGFLPLVFDRFRQADASTTRMFSGLGLGLAIVRHLVELHGGSVLARSGGRNQGATFAVSLPAHAAHSAAGGPAPADAPLARPADLRHLHVLVVDDEPDSRALVTAVLRTAGAVVAEAASADDALAALERYRCDLLVADIGMPDRDGYSLINAVRALPDPTGKVPAVAVTAYARAQDRARALDAGFGGVVTKPFDPPALLLTVDSVLSNGR